MRRVFWCLLLCTLLVFGISNSASAILVNKIVAGDRVVYDTLNDLYWYPILTDFTGKTRAEQKAAIDELFYAGTGKWRMATADETTLQKDSLAEMATVDVIPTSWADYGNPSLDNRTLSSPVLAYDVFPADFFTPTGYTEGAFWSGYTPAYMFNGRTTGLGWTNTGPGGFGGDLELMYAAADDHFVAHSFMSDAPFGTMTFNYDLHQRGDEETTMAMGGIGAWVVSRSVPEPSTISLLGLSLLGIIGMGRRKLK